MEGRPPPILRKEREGWGTQPCVDPQNGEKISPLAFANGLNHTAATRIVVRVQLQQGNPDQCRL